MTLTERYEICTSVATEIATEIANLVNTTEPEINNGILKYKFNSFDNEESYLKFYDFYIKLNNLMKIKVLQVLKNT